MNLISKQVLFFFILFFVSLQSVWTQEATQLSNSDTNRSENTPTKPLIIAYRIDSAPIQFINKEGQADGMLIDFWRLWSKKSGIPVQFSAGTNKETQNMLKQGDADIIAGLFSNKRRAEFLDFSGAILKSPYSLFLSPEINDIDSIEQLNEYAIGVTESSYHEDYLKTHYPEIKRQPFQGYNKLFSAAQTGELKIFIAQPLYLQRYLSLHGKTNQYKKMEPALYIRAFQAGVAKGNQQLLDKINQYFSIISQFEREAISSKWIGFNWIKPKNNDSDVTPYQQQSSINIPFTQAERDWLESHKQLTIGVMDNWPPFSKFNSVTGKQEGIDIDIIHQLNQHLDNRFRIIPGQWHSIYNKVKDKKLDVIMSITPDVNREEFFHFTRPYLKVPDVIVTQKNNSTYFFNEESLKGKVLALEKGFINNIYFEVLAKLTI